jgi:hypothetical protein
MKTTDCPQDIIAGVVRRNSQTDREEKLHEGISAIVNRYEDTKEWLVTTPTGAVIKLSEVFGSCAEHLRRLTGGQQ